MNSLLRILIVAAVVLSEVVALGLLIRSGRSTPATLLVFLVSAVLSVVLTVWVLFFYL